LPNDAKYFSECPRHMRKECTKIPKMALRASLSRSLPGLP
jgi:hypothetical protein